jgi:hypothetical protein
MSAHLLLAALLLIQQGSLDLSDERPDLQTSTVPS